VSFETLCDSTPNCSRRHHPLTPCGRRAPPLVRAPDGAQPWLRRVAAAGTKSHVSAKIALNEAFSVIGASRLASALLRVRVSVEGRQASAWRCSNLF